MSVDQIRARLSQAGYSPSLLDAYLTDSTQAQVPEPTTNVLEAVRALALLSGDAAPPAAAAAAAAAPAAAPPPDTPRPAAVSGRRAIFGLDVFARSTTQFQPVTAGPVPGSYVLGPGDELILIITGEAEASFTLPVTREGFVIIPRVGQIWVNGLTLDGLREQLYARLGRFYSGIKRGEGATTRFDVSLGRLRTNQVFVTGEVVSPGTYLVSTVASVLNALYMAGGPTEGGSMRDVQIVRRGRVAHHLDLYDYLLRGNNLDVVRFDAGDVLFLPPHGPRASIAGPVSRPGTYELRSGENISHLVRYAGGLSTPANLRRARITRVLPPAERRSPGVDRVVIDVDLASALADSVTAPALRDGDEIQVFDVRSEVRNIVSVSGGVWQPGTFSFKPGMRVWDLVRMAEGLMPEAYLQRGQIVRLRVADSTLSVVAFSLDTTATGAPVENPVLNEFDDVTVYTRTQFEPRQVIEVRGAVRRSGVQPMLENMTLGDAILRAGGLREHAVTAQAHISRLAPDLTRSVRSVTLVLDSTMVPQNRDTLQTGDVVSVYALEQFADSFTVAINGEVRSPGVEAYQDGLTLRDLIVRAGGLSNTADMSVEVARLASYVGRSKGQIAEVIKVKLDSSYLFPEPVARYYRGNRDSLGIATPPAPEFLLQPYDRVFVRRIPNFEPPRIVRIVGEVKYPGGYALQAKDERLRNIIERAGGLTATAFPDGFRMFRNGNLVNVDLSPVLRNARHRDNLVLHAGDSLVVPEFNAVVTVQGAVNSPSTVLYRSGAPLSHYIENAGGYARNADKGRLSVRYANGTARVPSRFLGMTVNQPNPGPGSVITVPLIPVEQRSDAREIYRDALQGLTTLATLLLVFSRL